MNIAVAYFGRGVGGIQVKIVEILNEMSKNRDDCITLLIRKREGNFLRHINPRITIIETLSPENFLSPLMFVIDSYKYLLINKPDIVLSYGDHTTIPLIISNMFLWKKARIVAAEGIYISKYLDHKKFRAVRMVLISILYRFTNKVLVLSKLYRKDLIERYHIPGNKIDLVKNWYGPKFKTIRRLPLYGERDIDILYVGRFEHQKNLFTMIDIMMKLVQRNKRIKCVMVGAGSLEFELKKYIDRLNLNNSIKLIGFRQSTKEYFLRSKLFLLTSHFEGVPRVGIEALKCGVPLVVRRYPGVRELHFSNLTGSIFNSTDQAVRKIEAIIVDKKIWSTMSRNCINDANRRFGMENLNDLILRVRGCD